METKATIARATGLSSVDLQYISEKFIPSSGGGGRRGKTLQFTKKALVEFAITKRFLSYGIPVNVIKSIFEFLREQKSYKKLFNKNGELINRKIISGKNRIYLQLFDAKPESIKFYLDDGKKDFNLFFPADSKDMMFLDVTPEFNLIVSTEENIHVRESIRIKLGY